MLPDADYYELLSVRRTATVTEISRAYKKRARLFHPDLNPGDPVAARRFAEIAAAFEVLSDPERRQRYDRGERVVTPTFAKPAVEFHGFDFSAGPLIQTGGVHELFSRTTPGGATGERGEDIEETARLTFLEAFHGTKRVLEVVRLDHCGTCGGAGEVSSDPAPCAACKGRGAVEVKRGRLVFSRRCGGCGGSGVRTAEDCAQCNGEGRVPRSERMEVQVPPGIRSGSRVRLAGAGHAGRWGAPAGDFVLAIDVEPDGVFRSEGDDLVCEVEVSAIDAALGGRIDVPTPDGPLTIEIPAGTQAGQRFRLRKRGLPRPGDGGRDDLFAEVRIVVPEVRDDEGRRLLEQFRSLSRR